MGASACVLLILSPRPGSELGSVTEPASQPGKLRHGEAVQPDGDGLSAYDFLLFPSRETCEGQGRDASSVNVITVPTSPRHCGSGTGCQSVTWAPVPSPSRGSAPSHYLLGRFLLWPFVLQACPWSSPEVAWHVILTQAEFMLTCNGVYYCYLKCVLPLTFCFNVRYGLQNTKSSLVFPKNKK